MHRVRSSRSAPSNRRRGLAFVLAMALVLVQMLGLGHRIVHADRVQLATAAAIAPSASADSPSALTSPGPRTGAGWMLALFASHDPGHDCDAFDHLSHADAVVGMTLDAAPPPAAAEETCFRHAAWHLAAQAQGFLARAPPSAA